jgi:exonuclease SbcC/exonuclease SbcD
MALSGADTGFDDFLMEHEPVLTQDAVSPFALVCLGHIHRPQQVQCGPATMAFYSGAPERHNFNDEAITPGFWIHDPEAGESKFIETPARPFITFQGDPSQDLPMTVKGAIVRCRFPMTEEQAKAFDRRAYERSLYDAGAFFVTEIRLDVEKTERSRDKEVTESLGCIQAVERWGLANEKTPEEIGVLQSLTAELMEEVC